MPGTIRKRGTSWQALLSYRDPKTGRQADPILGKMTLDDSPEVDGRRPREAGDRGLALQDGSLRVSHDWIFSGTGGLAVIASSVDTLAVLKQVKIAGTSGAPVQEFEGCGFTATTVGGP